MKPHAGAAVSAGGGIECPACGATQLPVYYTRRKAGRIVRLRECSRCGRRIRTVEKIGR